MVAIDARNTSLMTVLISNQFQELKVGMILEKSASSTTPPLLQATVFRKVEAASHFQITCVDVRERFQLLLMLFIIGVGSRGRV